MPFKIQPQPSKITVSCDFPDCGNIDEFQAHCEDSDIESFPAGWIRVYAQVQEAHKSGHTSWPDKIYCFCPSHSAMWKK